MNPSENPTIKLNPTGQPMPLVGLGLWKVSGDKATGTVLDALKVGYRLLDCASDYGNEKEIGDAIKQAFDDGIVKREDIFITSKLWNTNHARQHVRPSLERTLRDLRVDYLDLYLIHFPISLKYVDPDLRVPGWNYDPDKELIVQEPIPIQETWEAMEELVDAGLVKNIGVSNFSGSLLIDLLKYARIKPSVFQLELSPYLTQEKLVNYAKSQGLAITGYSNFGNLSYIEINVGRAREIPILFDQPIIKEIASNYGKSPAQIILKWSIQRQIAVIPKSLDRNRLLENRDLFDFQLTQEELHKISSLNANLRFNDPGSYAGIPIFD